MLLPVVFGRAVTVLVRGFAAGLMAGLMLGLLAGLTFGFPLGLISGLLAGVCFGAITAGADLTGFDRVGVSMFCSSRPD
jgi:hypothetical protein